MRPREHRQNDPKRHALRDALSVQGDRQFVRIRDQTRVGDNFVRAPKVHKPEDDGIWEALSLGLDELSQGLGRGSSIQERMLLPQPTSAGLPCHQ